MCNGEVCWVRCVREGVLGWCVVRCVEGGVLGECVG